MLNQFNLNSARSIWYASVTVYKAQGRTIRRLILSLSQHPDHRLRYTWEGLYVALSRIQYKDHLRLLINKNDWNTVQDVRRLKKCRYTDWYFKGYRDDTGEGLNVWDEEMSKTVAGFTDRERRPQARRRRRN